MAMSLVLDCFDTTETEDVDPAISEAYEQGFAAGLESKTSAIESNKAILEDNLISAISDLGFGYVEARSHLADGLRGLFSTITNRLVPQMLEATFAAHLAGELLDQCEAALSRPITLHLHPDKVGTVEPFLSAATGLTITCVGDETLGPSEARWGSANHEMTYDLAPLADSIRTALEAVLYETTKVENHG